MNMILELYGGESRIWYDDHKRNVICLINLMGRLGFEILI